MTVSGKESFLNTIAFKLGRERVHDVQRPDLKEWIPDSYGDLTTDELIEILKEQCFFIHTQLIESNPEILQRTLDDLIQANGGGAVITSGDTRFTDYRLNFPDSYVWEEAAGREEYSPLRIGQYRDCLRRLRTSRVRNDCRRKPPGSRPLAPLSPCPLYCDY